MLSRVKKIVAWHYRQILSTYRRMRNRLYANKQKLWNQFKDSEVDFWEEYIATEGLDKFKDNYRAKLDPELPLQEVVADCLQDLSAEEILILDVGAGPLTPLGKVYKGKKLKITAIDPLASEYDRILEKYNINPPVRTQVGTGENLLAQFQPETFDLAYSRNALDHSYDPLLAVKNMLAVVKKDGKVLLMHHKNEAEHENYQGLHQWNFDEREGKFLIWNQSVTHNLT